MNIKKIPQQPISPHLTPGKHKVPRYIYHLTNPDAYKKILKTGEIKPSKDEFFGNGVFAIEMGNFFKRWDTVTQGGNGTLMERLLLHVSKGKGEICILKIPTKCLDSEQLLIRSQDRLFGFPSLFKNATKELSSYMKAQISIGGSKNDIVMNALEKFFPETAKHIQFGAPAKFSKLFKQRGEAIEYIYPDKIPLDNIKKIGEVNLTELRCTNDYDIFRPLRSIFKKLLKGTPEVKSVELLNR